MKHCRRKPRCPLCNRILGQCFHYGLPFTQVKP